MGRPNGYEISGVRFEEVKDHLWGAVPLRHWRELSGIYILLGRGEVKYVGKSLSVQRRVQEHRLAWERAEQGKPEKMYGGCIPIQFDEVHVRWCPKDELDMWEMRFIEMLKPKMNVYLIREEVEEVDLKELGLDEWIPKKSSPRPSRRV